MRRDNQLLRYCQQTDWLYRIGQLTTVLMGVMVFIGLLTKALEWRGFI